MNSSTQYHPSFLQTPSLYWTSIIGRTPPAATIPAIRPPLAAYPKELNMLGNQNGPSYFSYISTDHFSPEGDYAYECPGRPDEVHADAYVGGPGGVAVDEVCKN
jgi:hypothetical protein